MENNIAVTGAEGFIGSWLSKYLSIPREKRFDILTDGDICDRNVQREIVKSKVIVHLAAVSGVKLCEQNLEKTFKNNVTGTIELANLAKVSGVKRFIFASSSSVYGEVSAFVMDESHPVNPRTAYGKSKLRAEEILALADENFEVVVLRKSNVYGWGYHWKSTVIDNFISKYLGREPIKITGTGMQKRNFVDLMDVVNLYGLIARRDRVRSGVYNVGGFETVTVAHISMQVNEVGNRIFGYTVPIEATPGEKLQNEWHDFKYDFSKAQMEFQFMPYFMIDDHIKARLMKAMRQA